MAGRGTDIKLGAIRVPCKAGNAKMGMDEQLIMAR